MKNSIFLSKHQNNGNVEVWINFIGNEGRKASVCLNNIANERGGSITRRAMSEAIINYKDNAQLEEDLVRLLDAVESARNEIRKP